MPTSTMFDDYGFPNRSSETNARKALGEMIPEHSLDNAANRRSFLMLLGIGAAATLLTGCGESTKAVTMLPSPVWRPREVPPPPIASGPAASSLPANAIPRTQWATGTPVASLMNRMLPIKHITVHHDGMEPFFAGDLRASSGRLDAIRRAHRGKGWGDIGYHFAVDREGRVWQGRPLNWQGAHVKDHNEGNIGVVALGNFDRQSPSSAQIASLNKCLTALMRAYNVPAKRVLTHQEWANAATACPGVHLQRYMVAVRNNRQLG